MSGFTVWDGSILGSEQEKHNSNAEKMFWIYMTVVAFSLVDGIVVIFLFFLIFQFYSDNFWGKEAIKFLKSNHKH